MQNSNYYDEYDGYKEWKIKENDWSEFFEISNIERIEYKEQFKALDLNISNAKILEIGFGTGKFLRWASEQGSIIEGIEIQEILLKNAYAKGITTYKSINEAGGPYDLIVGFDVLEHMSITQLKNLFSEASCKLTKNGKMFFRFPNCDSYAGLAAQNGDFTHITALGQSKIRQLISPFGFHIDKFTSRIDIHNNKFKQLIMKILRIPFIKIYGFNNPYFFSGNVVVVISK